MKAPTKEITPPEDQVSPITSLFQLLQSVDFTTPEAELNSFSMSDNNGGRILF